MFQGSSSSEYTIFGFQYRIAKLWLTNPTLPLDIMMFVLVNISIPMLVQRGRTIPLVPYDTRPGVLMWFMILRKQRQHSK